MRICANRLRVVRKGVSCFYHFCEREEVLLCNRRLDSLQVGSLMGLRVQGRVCYFDNLFLDFQAVRHKGWLQIQEGICFLQGLGVFLVFSRLEFWA